MMTMFLAFGLPSSAGGARRSPLGIVTVEKLKEWRSHFVVLAFIIAAVVTPPDAVSQLSPRS